MGAAEFDRPQRSPARFNFTFPIMPEIERDWEDRRSHNFNARWVFNAIVVLVVIFLFDGEDGRKDSVFRKISAKTRNAHCSDFSGRNIVIGNK